MSHKMDDSDFSSGATGLFDQLRKQQSQSNHIPVEVEKETTSAENRISDELASPEGAEANVLENGLMPPEARRALVSLLRQGVILASQKSKLFESICRYQSSVRNHLADVYLSLVLDEKAGVAFVAGLDGSEEGAEEDDAVSLISRRTLSLYDTLLLLVLRKHYQERETSGEQRVIIDLERVESNLSPFLPLTNSTRSDRKKLNAALQKMVGKRILSSVRGSDDRFEITPVIRYVVNAERLENILDEYRRLAKENGISTAGISASSGSHSATHELSQASRKGQGAGNE